MHIKTSRTSFWILSLPFFSPFYSLWTSPSKKIKDKSSLFSPPKDLTDLLFQPLLTPLVISKNILHIL